jgi:predicted RND superfamily exporter protein
MTSASKQHEAPARAWVLRLANGIFRWRLTLLLLGIAATIALAASATRLQVQGGFEKMVPLSHPYMKTFMKYQPDYGGANKVVVGLMGQPGDVFDPKFLADLKGLNDDLFFLPGVDRSSLISLYSPNTTYMEVVEDGFRMGQVLPGNFDGSAAGIAQFRGNLMKSAWLGRIVSRDFSGALISATLLDRDPKTDKPLDLRKVGAALEAIRAKHQTGRFQVRILGFAKYSSDIAAGASEVLLFFAIAALITALLLYWYTASFRITATALCVAAVPVVWLLGLMPLVGLSLDPISILAPFLIFSIGVSHAVQMTHAWTLETLRGLDARTSARNAFAKLFVPGTSALLANAIGFMVIAFVNIQVVRDLVITATLGVTLMIGSNKVLLPILLSYMKADPHAHVKAGHERLGGALWTRLSIMATPAKALPVVLVAVALLGVGVWKAHEEVIGDLGVGVPELRADSRYNQDVKEITRKFALGVDVLQVIAQAAHPNDCNRADVLDAVDRFDFDMRQSDDVQSVRSLAGFVKGTTVGFSEGDVKWSTIPSTRDQRNQAIGFSTRGGGDLINGDCSAMNIAIYPINHQAATLARIVARVKDFQQRFDSDEIKFLLASGNDGVMAATNEAVAKADHWVNFALFGAVTLLCLLTFRSLAITACIVIPLGIVTVLCYALMASLGIGMKVNTLPVVALGVGVGVDYGIYLFEVMRHEMKERSCDLQQAFLSALQQRGAASLFTAVTMSIGVGTWVFSSLKMQADMGVLLVFMFLINALAALLLLPALSVFLIRRRPVQH